MQNWYNQGGGVMSEEERRRKAAAGVAKSQVAATPQQAAAPLQPGQIGQRQNPLQGLLQKGLKAGLTGALGPLGGLLGGLFNNGGRVGLNDGGSPKTPMGPLNPSGYNEGGPGVGPTPIKRLQDEQKVELDRMSWDRMEGRKDQQMMMDEKRKEEAFQEEQIRKDEAHKEAMKMKKAAATTNKKAPLAGK